MDRLSTGRRLGVRIPAVLGLLLFAFFFSIVVAEAAGVLHAGAEGSPDDPPPSAVARFGASRPAEAVHVVGAAGALAIGASGLVALIGRPERSGSAYHVLSAMTALVLTLPIVGNPDNYGGQAGSIDPLFLVLAVPSVIAALIAAPRRHRGSPVAFRARFLLLAAVAAGPAGWYGVDQALLQRNTFPPTADPHHNAHWWAMAVFAFSVVLVVAVAAIPSRGWRLGPRVAGVAAIAFGVACLAAPSAASAVGRSWAAAAVIWGAAAIWLTAEQGERRAERSP